MEEEAAAEGMEEEAVAEGMEEEAVAMVVEVSISVWYRKWNTLTLCFIMWKMWNKVELPC
jgi:hypothetical protein